MHPLFYQTRARFLQASRKRFADWGEANNHQQVGAALSEFYGLFVVHCPYYQRLRWIRGKKPIYYRQAQLGDAMCDRFLGHTPYGKMFSKLTRRLSPLKTLVVPVARRRGRTVYTGPFPAEWDSGEAIFRMRERRIRK